MVVDLGLPDMSGFELINRIRYDLGLKELRIVVYTGRELTREEEMELRRVSKASSSRKLNHWIDCSKKHRCSCIVAPIVYRRCSGENSKKSPLPTPCSKEDRPDHR